MHTLYVILYVAAALCFLLGTFPAAVSTRINLVALGLLFAVLVPLIQTARA